MKRKYPWQKTQVKDHHPIEAGAVVRGSWSTIEYEVEITGDCVGEGWGIQGRQVDNNLGTGWFSFLGERKGNEIEVLDPQRPDDRVVVLSEPRPKPKQMDLAL